MDADAVFKRYDIRGEYEDEIDREFARILGKAVGTFAIREYGGEVTICRDNKTSSIPLKKELAEGIISTGADLYDAGTGPTDYAAYTGRKFGTVTVQVTSSHLPLNFNGFKLMYPEGNGFKNPDLDRIEDLFRSKGFEHGDGNATKVEQATKKLYREELLEYADKFGEINGKKVVVETMGGAGREILPELLRESGAEVVDLSEGKPEGPYLDPPKPEPELLEEVEEKVREKGAYLGIATDMDADRVSVYFDGSWLTGDELFAILAQLFESDVVASVDTSKAVEEVVEKNGFKTYYTRVGDPFVVDEALKRDVKLAGEPNGHYCFTDFVPYNSGILAALILARLELREVLEEVPKYFTESRNIEVEDKEKRLSSVAEEARQRFEIDSEIDGIKYLDGDAAVLIRSSGSSPILRVKAESHIREEAERAAEAASQIIRNP